MNITARFADMIPYLATIMQFADVSFALLQILPDDKAQCNELMLLVPWCTGASCRMLQIPSNFAANTTQLRDSDSKRPTYDTPILSHRGAFTKAWFHTGILHIHMLLPRDGFTRKHLHAQMFLHRDVFYTKKQLHTDAWAILHADAFTQRCIYRGVLLHARALTQGFS